MAPRLVATLATVAAGCASPAGPASTTATTSRSASDDAGATTTVATTRPASQSRPRRIEGARSIVARVNDGDTIVLASGRRVRLVQVDTPEVYGEAECYGAEASALTKRLLPAGTPVTLQRDPLLDDTDHYDRLLRYVFVGTTNVNRTLVRRGAASVWFYDGERGRYADDLLRDVRFARDSGLGLWSACRGTRLDVTEGVNTGSVSSHRSSNPAAARTGATGGRYRWPARDVDCSQIGYGYANWLLRRDRTDPFRLDRDGDGVACEG